MALVLPTNDLTGNTIAATYDQILFVDNAAGIAAEGSLYQVATQTGESALHIGAEKIKIQPADSDPTNQVELFRINKGSGNVVFDVDATNGRVGIGIAVPTSTLHVAASTDVETFQVVNSQATTTAARKLFHFHGSNGSGNADADLLVVETGRGDGQNDFNIFRVLNDDGDVFNIRQNGNVGIGTATPTALLDVVTNDSDDQTMFRLREDSDGDAMELFIELSDTGISGLAPKNVVFRGGSVASDMAFSPSSDTPGALVIQDGGNVGIGTANPHYPLHVRGGTSNARILLASATTSEDVSIALSQGVDGTNAGWGIGLDNSNSKALTFAYDASDGEDVSLTNDGLVVIDVSGNVGIGTAAPESLFEIAATGADSVGPMMTLRNTSTGINDGTDYILGEINFAGNDRLGGEDGIGAKIIGYAGAAWNATENDNPAFLAFYTNDNGVSPLAERMRITHEGNIGIGTIVPGELLEIAKSASEPVIEISCWSTNAAHEAALHFQKSASATINTLLESPTNGNLGCIRAYGVDDGSGGSPAKREACTILFEQDADSDADAAPGRMIFKTSSAAGLSEAMRINKDGYVGIGGIDPLKKLHVAASRILVDAANASGDVAYVMAQTTGGGSDKAWAVGLDHSNTQALTFAYDATGGEDISLTTSAKAVITTAGLVGIGTADPHDELHVVGSMFLEDGSPEITFETTSGSHENWQIAVQENVSNALEISEGSQDADASNDTFTPRFVIKAGGNVGIGDTSPSADLQVNGNLNTALSDSTSVVSDGATGTNRYVASTSHGLLVGDAVRLLDTGESAGGDYSKFTVATVTDANNFIIDSDGDAAEDKGQAYKDSDLLRIKTGDNSPRVSINKSGYVGIGTASPDTLLTLADATNPMLTLSRGTDTSEVEIVDGSILGQINFSGHDDGSYEGVQSGAWIRGEAGGTWDSVDVHDAPGELQFWTQSNGDADVSAQRMTIDKNGNVGIGLTNPQNKLQVQGIGTSGGKFSLSLYDATIAATNVLGTIQFLGTEDGSAFSTGAEITATASNDWTIDSDCGTDLGFWTTPNNSGTSALAQRMTIDDAGNVGIGNISPANMLHVEGSQDGTYMCFLKNTDADNPRGININFSASSNLGDDTDNEFIHCNDSDGMHFAVYGDGDVVNADDSYGSDRRIKTEIVDATSKLDDINKIKVRNFKFQHNDGTVIDKKRIGFIADEMKEVFPSVVKERKMKLHGHDYDDMQTITGSALVPILVKAIQELSAKVEALENNNNEQGDSSNGKEEPAADSGDSEGDASSESSGEDSGGAEGDSDNPASSSDGESASSESSSDSSNESSGSSGSVSSDDSEAGSGGDDSSGSESESSGDGGSDSVGD